MIKKLIYLFILFIALLTSVYAESALATTKITYADTILAKVVSEIYGYPIVLLDKDGVSNETLQELEELNITEILIIGGPAVVSYKVEEELKSLGYNVIRIWGVTRYETSAEVARFFWDYSDKAVIATREIVNEKAGIKEVMLVRKAVEKAIEEKAPILITPPGQLEENVIKVLVDLGVKEVYIFTLSGNIKNITDTLNELGIKYEIFTIDRPVMLRNCTKIIKIAVPEDVNWTFAREIFIGKKCVEILPVPLNMTLDELRKQFDYVILSEEDRLMFKKEILENFKQKALEIREKIRERLENKIGRILEILIEEIKRYEELYNETGNQTFLEIVQDISSVIEEIKKLLDKEEIEEAFRLGLQAIHKIREIKWKYGIYLREIAVQDIRKSILERIKAKIKSVGKLYNLPEEDVEEAIKNISREEYVKEIYIRHIEVLKNIIRKNRGIILERLNLSVPEEDIENTLEDIIELRRWMPDPYELREKLIRACIQIVVTACSPWGECREFANPCLVPKGWTIIRPRLIKPIETQ